MTTVRAIVGARVSHVQGEEKTSHITQRSTGQEYAESQGWTVVGVFEDLDVSAIKLSPWDRPDLKTWLTDRADDWDALIFAKTDRVFRSVDAAEQLCRLLDTGPRSKELWLAQRRRDTSVSGAVARAAHRF